MYRSRLVFLVSAIILGVVISAPVPANGQTAGHVTYLRCGSLIDGKSEQARKNVVIAVEGEKIKEVGGAEAGSDVIDLSRETCLPGLIDTHTHVLLQGDITAADYDAQLLKESPEYRTIVATVNLWRALAFGFTTIRDLETEGAGYADVDLKRAINNGVIPGPRMQVATARARRDGRISLAWLRTERAGTAWSTGHRWRRGRPQGRTGTDLVWRGLDQGVQRPRLSCERGHSSGCERKRPCGRDLRKCRRDREPGTR